MKTAQRPLDRTRMVVLNECIRDPKVGELSFVIRLDEEATRLMALQRSYQAASRMVTVIDSLSQTLIDMIR